MTVTDPYAVLGLTTEADDAAIKQRYLDLVRAHPPDREPERFQEVRAAYDLLRTRRDRLAFALLKADLSAVTRLKRRLLEPEGPVAGRASRAAVGEVLLEAVSSDRRPDGRRITSQA